MSTKRLTPAKRRGAVIIATLSIAALALTACTSGSGSNESTAKPTELKNTGWVSADRDAITDGGTVTLPVDALPQNYNQFQVDSGTVDDQAISQLYYANYVSFKPDGSWQVNSDYADSVKLVSEDPQVVEVKINPKAVWSDGTQMSVNDFVSNWKAQNGDDTTYQTLATNVWQDIESIKAGDNAQDVKITYKNKNADWPSILTLLPAYAVNSPEAFNTAWAKGPFGPDGKTYVSGGPFVVKSIDQTGQVLIFERNPKWWGDAPKLDTVIYKTVSRAGIAQAFGNKEIDVMNFNGSADNYATAKKRTDATIERSLGTTFRHITLNGTSSVFKDQAVRQAFARSLNRQVIAQSRLAPVGSPIVLLNSLIYLPGQTGYQDNGSKVLGYDPDAAKKLLDDDGWKGGDGEVREKNGKKLTVRFVIPSDNPASAEVAQQVQAQTKVAGFKVNIDVVPSNDFFTKYIHVPDRDFDATYFAWQGTPFPVSSAKSIYYPADSGQNYSGITTNSLGKLWDTANAALDSAKRVKDANAIDKVIVKQATTIPLFPEPYAWAVKNGLVNYGPSQFQVYSVQWQNVGWKK